MCRPTLARRFPIRATSSSCRQVSRDSIRRIAPSPTWTDSTRFHLARRRTRTTAYRPSVRSGGKSGKNRQRTAELSLDGFSDSFPPSSSWKRSTLAGFSPIERRTSSVALRWTPIAADHRRAPVQPSWPSRWTEMVGSRDPRRGRGATGVD